MQFIVSKPHAIGPSSTVARRGGAGGPVLVSWRVSDRTHFEFLGDWDCSCMRDNFSRQRISGKWAYE